MRRKICQSEKVRSNPSVLSCSVEDVLRQLASIPKLNGENSGLRDENEALRRRVEELETQIEEKDGKIGSLQKDVEKWRRGFTERRKRRTSRAERKVEGPRKKPGRKAGHPGARRPEPERIDEEVEYKVPEHCACGGAVETTEETRSTTVEDIPPIKVVSRRHTARVGVCTVCKKKVWSPLPGDVEAGRSVANVQIGPNLQAMAIGLRYEQKTSFGNISGFFQQWFGVSITRGGLSQIVIRLGKEAELAYKEIETDVRGSSVTGFDETGFRQDGKTGWCWVARTARATLFRLSPSRGAKVFDDMLGQGFLGVVVSDFYSVYTRRDDLLHGYCGAHVIRDAKKIAELKPCPETFEFRDRIQAFYAAGAKAQASGDALKRRGARIRLGHLVASLNFVGFTDIVRLQERLSIHFDGVARFLDDPNVPWNNNGSERDIRDVARFRAVTGGTTRSPRGDRANERWWSIKQTRTKNGLPLGSFIRGVYDARVQSTGPPSVFAP